MPFKSQQRGNIEAYPLKNGLGLYLSGYRYAATLNKGYQQIDEAFGRQLGDLEGKRAEAGLETANAVTDWLKGLDLGEKLKGAWEHQGEALKSYGDAMRRRDEKTADTAKSLWDRHQTNATTLANARAAQTKAQTEGIREIANSEIVRSVMDHYGESMKAYGMAMSEQGEYVKEGLYLSGKYSGVTGSDQTGASIHGYREDTSWKKPTSEWNSQELEDYRILMAKDPELAADFAAGVNDRYNQIAHDAEVQEIAEGTSQYGIAAAIGARAAGLVDFLDVYNKSLERAVVGRNNVSRNVNLGEIKEIVDATNEDNISRKYGEDTGNEYNYGTMIADMVLKRSALPKELATTKSIVNTLGRINEMYQDSGASSVWEFAEDTSDKIKSIEVGSREWFAEKHEEIEKQTSEYMKRGLSEKTARWKATKELIQQSLG